MGTKGEINSIIDFMNLWRNNPEIKKIIVEMSDNPEMNYIKTGSTDGINTIRVKPEEFSAAKALADEINEEKSKIKETDNKADTSLSPETLEALRAFGGIMLDEDLGNNIDDLAETEEKTKVQPKEKHNYKSSFNKKVNNIINKARTLKNKAKKLAGKVYKLAQKTKEKVEAYIAKNGIKKTVAKILVIATIVTGGVLLANETAKDMETFREVAGIEQREDVEDDDIIRVAQKAKDESHQTITEEIRKALNNNNLETELEILPASEDEGERLKITVIDPLNPDKPVYEHILGGMFNQKPSYMRKIAMKYIESSKICDKVNPNITDAIKEGDAVRDTRRLAGKNDIIIKKSSIGDDYKMKAVPEYFVLEEEVAENTPDLDRDDR